MLEIIALNNKVKEVAEDPAPIKRGSTPARKGQG
jgi:hypothetical protein